MVTTSEVFASIELDLDLREMLLDRLALSHAEHPFAADDPRGVVARVMTDVGDLGLDAVRIRGTVSVAGVEVDHVWLAVAGRPHWVLDASFPLLEPTFVSMLASYVAGTTSAAELAAIAVGQGVDRRVLGAIPPAATYRGQPYWSRRRK
ncbi:MAG TPA: hypothetical protein VMM13_15810 [Euzebya sp.]|nr:hypothetical protein [Euzebya sp.]